MRKENVFSVFLDKNKDFSITANTDNAFSMYAHNQYSFNLQTVYLFKSKTLATYDPLLLSLVDTYYLYEM